jgi:hypothetical protein
MVLADGGDEVVVDVGGVVVAGAGVEIAAGVYR